MSLDTGFVPEKDIAECIANVLCVADLPCAVEFRVVI